MLILSYQTFIVPGNILDFANIREGAFLKVNATSFGVFFVVVKCTTTTAKNGTVMVYKYTHIDLNLKTSITNSKLIDTIYLAAGQNLPKIFLL